MLVLNIPIYLYVVHIHLDKRENLLTVIFYIHPIDSAEVAEHYVQVETVEVLRGMCCNRA